MVYLRISFILVALLMGLIIEGTSVDNPTCGSNEEYNACGTHCQRTCADINTREKLCHHMCAIGCFCIDDYVRQKDENSPCIKENEC